MPDSSPYTARFSTPDWIERARDNTITLAIYRDGALVAPSAGTVSVFDADGTAIVDGESVTVTASVATYAIASATLPTTLALSDRWREEWTLTLDGTAVVFRRSAGLVRSRLFPVVTDLDLTRLHSELRQWLADDATSLQNYIDGAWDQIQLRLIEDGRWPYLVLSPSSLRNAHLALALHMAFLDYASSAGGAAGKYDSLSTHYGEQFERAWGRLKFTYDFDQDNKVDSDEQGVSGSPVLMLTAPGRWQHGWGRSFGGERGN